MKEQTHSERNTVKWKREEKKRKAPQLCPWKYLRPVRRWWARP